VLKKSLLILLIFCSILILNNCADESEKIPYGKLGEKVKVKTDNRVTNMYSPRANHNLIVIELKDEKLGYEYQIFIEKKTNPELFEFVKKEIYVGSGFQNHTIRLTKDAKGFELLDIEGAL
jgi:hypothetical protein